MTIETYHKAQDLLRKIESLENRLKPEELAKNVADELNRKVSESYGFMRPIADIQQTYTAEEFLPAILERDKANVTKLEQLRKEFEAL